MKRIITSMMLLAAMVTGANAQTKAQLDSLDRGLVVVRTSSNFISWRMLAGEDDNTTSFDVLRDDQKEPIVTDSYKTNYTDWSGKLESQYRVVTKVNGVAVDTTEAVAPFFKYKTLKLDLPAGGNDYSYTPNDCSVGDIDGDGQYELFVKWDPSNSQDNSKSGKTGNVYIDCYKLDGTKLWRIDLGVNIRAGAHYTQFMVYDFDQDGKAEMICKTAPGTKDGLGRYVTEAATNTAITDAAGDNTKDFRNSSGRIIDGQEYLTVFDGQTGKAIHTIFYNPNRGMNYGAVKSGDADVNWHTSGTDKASYGNRGERYLAAVAHLDGMDKPASGIFCRGYYSYAFIWAVTFDGQELHQKWFHESRNENSCYVTTFDETGKGTKKAYTQTMLKAPTSGKGSRTMFSNGNHNMTIGDVDGDGCDEIIWGSAALNNDGTMLYATGFGHGDAIHLGKMIPDEEGYQLFQIHEESPYGWDLHDALTGKVLYSATGPEDNGRGMAADFVTTNRGWEFWSAHDTDGTSRNPHSAATGKTVSTDNPSMNFRIYWDGSIHDQLLDGGNGSNPIIKKWTSSGIATVKEFGTDDGAPQSCNSTKSTPNLQADLFGDWREELVMRSTNDPSILNIYTTSIKTEYRMPTLMHDHNYRMAICWQNTAYNQPPHVSTYLPDEVGPTTDCLDEYGYAIGDSIIISGKLIRCKNTKMTSCKNPNGDNANTEFKLTTTNNLPFSSRVSDMELKGVASMSGIYSITLTMTGLGNETVNKTINLYIAANPNGIENITAESKKSGQCYNMQGQRIAQPQKGIFIKDNRKYIAR